MIKCVVRQQQNLTAFNAPEIFINCVCGANSKNPRALDVPEDFHFNNFDLYKAKHIADETKAVDAISITAFTPTNAHTKNITF